jgi:putative transposase
MPPLSYSGYCFPRDIIQRAVWMYLRFTLSFRDVEDAGPTPEAAQPLAH